MSNFETDAIGHVVTADELTFDEATIIREQERLAVEKKKKKRKKIRNIILLILLLIILTAVAWYFIWGKKMLAKAADNTVQIEKTEAQSITFVKVNSINGNEIDYTVLKEQEVAEEESTAESSRESPSTGGQNAFDSQGSSRTDGDSFGGQGGSAPEGFDASNFGDQGSSMPEGFDPSTFGGFGGGDGSGMPSGFDSSSFGGFGSGQNSAGNRGGSSSSSKRTNGTALTYNGTTYIMTEDTRIEYIPVGTDVTTKLGTKTTFSRISAGDCLALVTETINGEEVIMAVYIVG